jgi:hypothetical protein
MPMLPKTIFAFLTLSCLVACGPREPGPHEFERGEVAYWQVTSSELKWGHLCSDKEGGIDQVEEPEFEENSYIMYLLSDDGSQATAQNCETLQASTCADSETGIVFDVDGNTLTWNPEPEITDVAGDCDLQSDEIWTLTDEGESAELVVGLVFSLVGEQGACDLLQSDLQAEAPNGQGLEGCTMDLEIGLAFDRSRTP